MTTKKTTTKKKTAKRKTKKKRVIKTQQGKSLREVRAAAMNDSTAHWPWPLRPYQQEAYDAFNAGKQRQLLVWHRRAGKDIFGMSLAQDQMRKRIGGYVHFFPKHIQAKRAIWNGIDPKKGARFVDIAFNDIEAERNNTEMLIEAFNGSTWQLLGSDNYDRIVGANIVGAVFSEFALCDPRSWDYIRPMLLENGGWAVFITTYRGRNHAWQMMQKLKDNPEWYCTELSVEKTSDINGNRILTDEDIEAERQSGMSEAMIQQEYYCNPEATSTGAIYGRQVDTLRNDDSRHVAAYDPGKPVMCFWRFDLPIHASCILAQPGDKPRILGAYTYEETTLAEAIAKAEQRHYPIQSHVISASQLYMATQLKQQHRYPLVISDRDAREAFGSCAALIDRCSINKPECEDLLDSLSGYVRRERFDAQVADMQFSDKPVQSWHERLVLPLESFAVWEYHLGGGEWGKPADYSAQDRIAKTLI